MFLACPVPSNYTGRQVQTQVPTPLHPNLRFISISVTYPRTQSSFPPTRPTIKKRITIAKQRLFLHASQQSGRPATRSARLHATAVIPMSITRHAVHCLVDAYFLAYCMFLACPCLVATSRMPQPGCLGRYSMALAWPSHRMPSLCPSLGAPIPLACPSPCLDDGLPIPCLSVPIQRLSHACPVYSNAHPTPIQRPSNAHPCPLLPSNAPPMPLPCLSPSPSAYARSRSHLPIHPCPCPCPCPCPKPKCFQNPCRPVCARAPIIYQRFRMAALGSVKREEGEK